MKEQAKEKEINAKIVLENKSKESSFIAKTKGRKRNPFFIQLFILNKSINHFIFQRYKQ
jgi:hypothetical protein